jgi:hypothetical protein
MLVYVSRHCRTLVELVLNKRTVLNDNKPHTCMDNDRTRRRFPRDSDVLDSHDPLSICFPNVMFTLINPSDSNVCSKGHKHLRTDNGQPHSSPLSHFLPPRIDWLKYLKQVSTTSTPSTTEANPTAPSRCVNSRSSDARTIPSATRTAL